MVAIVASCNMLRAPRVHGAGLGGEAAAPTVPVRPNTTNADPSASARFILSPLVCGPLEPRQCRVAALPQCGLPMVRVWTTLVKIAQNPLEDRKVWGGECRSGCSRLESRTREGPSW